MRKLSLLAALSLSLALAACDSSNNAVTSVPEGTTPSSTSGGGTPTTTHTELVGKWTAVGLYGVDFTIVLGSQKTFSTDYEMNSMFVQGSRANGTWNVSGDSLVLMQSGESSNRDNGAWSFTGRTDTSKYQYTLKNDTLRMTYKGSLVAMVRTSKTAIPVFDTAAAPTFSVAGGTYTSVQNVSIVSATSGCSFYYTVDGSIPTTASKLYSGPIQLSASATLKAIAVHGGLVTSPASSVSYVIQLPPTLADSLVGTWSYDTSVGKVTMTLGKEGSYTFVTSPYVYSNDIVGMDIQGSWSLAGHALKTAILSVQTSSDGKTWTKVVNPSDYNDSQLVMVTANTLTLKLFDDSQMIFTRTK